MHVHILYVCIYTKLNNRDFSHAPMKIRRYFNNVVRQLIPNTFTYTHRY